MNWLRRILSILLNQTNENRAKKGKRAKTKEKSQKTQDFAKSLQDCEQVRRLKQVPTNKAKISVYKEEEKTLPPLPSDDKNLKEATVKSKSIQQSNSTEDNCFTRTIEDYIQKGQKITKTTSLGSGREEEHSSNRTDKGSNISKQNRDKPYHDCRNTDTDIHHLKELAEEDIKVLYQPENNHPLEPTEKIDDNEMLGVVLDLILPKLETVNFICVKRSCETEKVNRDNKTWLKILFRLNKRLVFKPECCLGFDPKESDFSLIDMSKVQLFWGQVNFLLIDYESPKPQKSSNAAKDYDEYSYIITKLYDFKQILNVLLTKKDFVLIDTEDSSFKKSQSYLIWLKLLVRLKRRKVFEPQRCLENYLSQSHCYLIDWESVKIDLKIVNFLLVDYTPLKSFYRPSKSVAKDGLLSSKFEYLPSQRYPLDFRLALKGLNLQTWSNPSLRILPAETVDGVDESRTNALENHSQVESLYQSKGDKNGSDCMNAGVSDTEPITDPKGLDTTKNQTSQRKYITKVDWGKPWKDFEQSNETRYVWIDLTDPIDDSTRSALYAKLSKRQLIGLDLLKIVGNQPAEGMIFEKADRGLILLSRLGDSTNGDLTVEYYPYIAAAATMVARKEYSEKRFYEYLKRYLPRSSKELSGNKINKIVLDVAERFSHKRKIDIFIRHSIVPDKYLNEFINYLYKIYREILSYSIPEEIGSVLKQMFADQRKKLNGEDSNSSVGSMNGLIKATHELVLNKKWHLELVEYSTIILQWIDSYFWESKGNENSDVLKFPEYFKPYFDSWRSSVLSENRQTKGVSRSRRTWKPEFRLYNNQVQLKTPSIILFKAYKSLKIFVYNGDDLLIEKDGQIKSNIVDGNKVLVLESFNLEINNPLDSLRLIINSGNERIYDSNYDLNRSVILFNSEEEAKELRATNNLPDQVFCVVPKDKKIENVEILKSSGHYDLGYINLFENEVAIVGELVLTQQRQSTVLLVGQKIKGYSISYGSHQYPVYKSIRYLKIRTTNNSMDSLFLKVEDKNYRLRKKDFILDNS